MSGLSVEQSNPSVYQQIGLSIGRALGSKTARVGGSFFAGAMVNLFAGPAAGLLAASTCYLSLENLRLHKENQIVHEWQRDANAIGTRTQLEIGQVREENSELVQTNEQLREANTIGARRIVDLGQKLEESDVQVDSLLKQNLALINQRIDVIVSSVGGSGVPIEGEPGAEAEIHVEGEQ